MNTTPSDQEDKKWKIFLEKLERYCRGDDQPITALMLEKEGDDKWREKVIDYLITACGEVTDDRTPYHVSILGTICDYYRPKDVSRIMQFINHKLLELGKSVAEEKTLNNQQIYNARFTGQMIINLLKSMRCDEAVPLMEQIYKDNKDNEMGWMASTSLVFMKQLNK